MLYLSGIRLETHMQIVDIGSLGIKNVLNDLDCRRKSTSAATTRMQSTRHVHTTIQYIVIIQVPACLSPL